ncbi:uncharacterized membrane protein YjjB (DUF3815 family) [Rhodoblastus acidophilus]|uniref:threonine/serine exporter family protein n=1 Tax=Rhodoblastus acidophilus TaxID=1074 RepID=UPI0022246715|nr:threonine/serine exporter family protein [Rhodoblastus acidophilus]MCW2286460.1 uncharacterized membrane protein YjjB (DUF3815 family) [Rhodoblastus acidophilus]MCW2335309.1 uncharacterized membrane protein YjjB (DUF3815 family) [Rhodoblastus acidophilus]
MTWAPHLLHQAFFGGLAAAGFGILFNFGLRALPWPAAAGALALGVRAALLSAGWSLESASFVAALSCAAALFPFRRRLGPAAGAIALAGCIPMIPGAFFGDALLGFLAVSSPVAQHADATLVKSLQSLLRVFFTLAAIGAGLAIPSQIFGRSRLTQENAHVPQHLHRL